MKQFSTEEKLEAIIKNCNNVISLKTREGQKNNAYILYGPNGKKTRNGLSHLISAYSINKELVQELNKREIVKNEKYKSKLDHNQRIGYENSIINHLNINKFLKNNYELLLNSAEKVLQYVPLLNAKLVSEAITNISAQKFIIAVSDTCLCEKVLSLYNSKIKGKMKEFSTEAAAYIQKYVKICENRDKEIKKNETIILSSSDYNNIDFLHDAFRGVGNDNGGGQLKGSVKSEIIDISYFLQLPDALTNIPETSEPLKKKSKQRIGVLNNGKDKII
ncbi:MAG: hypothetical protein WC376_04800 [Candidatus Nanoarchaeia archaeon]|jgi:hypothetical protein